MQHPYLAHLCLIPFHISFPYFLSTPQPQAQPASVEPTDAVKWDESSFTNNSHNDGGGMTSNDPFSASQPEDDVISSSNPWANSDKWEMNDSWNPFATDVRESGIEHPVLPQVSALARQF